jgi:hypothetical protein
MFKIKFGLMPGHWGLKGKTRDIAQAEYELTGAALEKRLLDIKKDELTDEAYNRKLWDIELKYKEIDENTYHARLIDLIKDDKQRAIAKLELDFRNGVMTRLEYEKATATVNGEPWVTVLNMDFNKKTSLEGSFELDWNDLFVDKLRSEGYSATSPDLIVNQWFMEVCRNIALEEFDGTGNFTADSEANLESFKRWNSEAVPAGKKAYG